jgi:pimeloyl-ACP methyl ester carboxylesterase
MSSNFAGWALGQLARRDPASALERLMPDPANRQLVLDDPEKLAAFSALASSATSLQERRKAGRRNDSIQFDALAVPDLAAIHCPTLVLHGTADRNVPIAMGELVASGVPGAEIVRFEGADHFMILSHAEEIMRVLFGFADLHSGLSPDRWN